MAESRLLRAWHFRSHPQNLRERHKPNWNACIPIWRRPRTWETREARFSCSHSRHSPSMLILLARQMSGSAPMQSMTHPRPLGFAYESRLLRAWHFRSRRQNSHFRHSPSMLIPSARQMSGSAPMQSMTHPRPLGFAFIKIRKC